MHRDADGKVKQTWECRTPEAEATRLAMEAAVRALCEDITRALPIPAPAAALADLLALYTLTDGHVGMKAWHREGGQDWDLSRNAGSMNAPSALRRAADTVEACAIGDETDALLVLWARAGERLAMGTLQADEAEALIRLMRG